MPGFKEKKRTRAKKMAEKTRSAVLSEIWLPRTGWIPVVKEVVAHLGIAKHGQIKQTGEKVTVTSAYFGSKCLQPVRMCISNGCNPKNGNSYSCNDKAGHSREQVPSCKLSKMDRKDQVSGAEEHTK